jgi:hypothetical protein
MRTFFKNLVRYLESHDCGASADAYFCVDENGKVVDSFGMNGFEECTDKNKDGATREFIRSCNSGGGKVRGGCIDA